MPRAGKCCANQREYEHPAEHSVSIVEREVGIIPIEMPAQLRRQIEVGER